MDRRLARKNIRTAPHRAAPSASFMFGMTFVAARIYVS